MGGKVSIVIVEGKFDCQIAVIFTHTRLMIASSFEEQKNDAALHIQQAKNGKNSAIVVSSSRCTITSKAKKINILKNFIP